MDEDDSDVDIPLPPLPTKPQKTLFSFFGSTKKPVKKVKTIGKPVKKVKTISKMKETESICNEKLIEANGYKDLEKTTGNKIDEKYRKDLLADTKPNKNSVVSDVDSDVEGEEERQLGKHHHRKKLLPLQSSDEEDMNDDMNDAMIADVDDDVDDEVLTKKTVVNTHLNFPVKNKLSSPSKYEHVKPCSTDIMVMDVSKLLTTPFPTVNHTLQADTTSTQSDDNDTKDLNKKIKLKVNNIEVSDLVIGNKDYAKLNLFQTRSTTEADSNVQFKSLEECLLAIEECYPEFPVKKVFQQYLQCQKNIITTNLEKIEASRKAISSVWEKDAAQESLELNALKESSSKCEHAPVEQPKAKEGKDIRSMFTNVKKKSIKKKKSVIKENKTNVENVCIGEISVGDQTVSPVIDIEEEISPVKHSPLGVNLSSLFGKAQRRREERKQKQQQQICKVKQSEEENIVSDNKSEMRRSSRIKVTPSYVIDESSNESSKESVVDVDVPTEEVKKTKKKESKDIITLFKNTQRPCEEISNKDDVTCEENKNIEEHVIEMHDTNIIPQEQEVQSKDIRNLFKISNKPLATKNVVPQNENSEISVVITTEVESVQSKVKVKSKKVSLASLLNPQKNTLISNKKVEKTKDIRSLFSNINHDTVISNSLCVNDKSASACSEEKDKTVETQISLNLHTSNQEAESVIIKAPMEVDVHLLESGKNENISVNSITTKTKDEVSSNRTTRKRKGSESSMLSNKKLKKEENEIDTEDTIPVKRRSLQSRNSLSEKVKSVKDEVIDVCKTLLTTENNKELEIKLVKTEEVFKSESKELNSKNILISKKRNQKVICDETVDTSLRRSSRSRKAVVNYNEHVLDLQSTVIKSTKIKEVNVEKKKNKTLKVSKIDDVKYEPILDESVMVTVEQLDQGFNTLQPKRQKTTIEVVLNNDTMNSFLTWTEKYQPSKARYVIGDKLTIRSLFDWLHLWKEKHEAIIKKLHERAKRKLSRKRTSDSEDESDFSDEEDLLSNTLLLTGPVGCGTTAAVYACAKQMDFKIHELNPSVNRTGKYIFDQVSEAVVSHQVQKGLKKKLHNDLKEAAQGSKHMKSFFASKDNENDRTSVDAMSLVLFEQADILFEELDRGFWTGIQDLRKLSKRPIILTANDPSISVNLNLEDNVWMDHISLSHQTRDQTRDQILPMIQLMCLTEQVYISEDILLNFCLWCNNDVRKIINQLQFWFEQGKEPLFSLKKKSKNKEKSFNKCNELTESKDRNNISNENKNENINVTNEQEVLSTVTINNHDELNHKQHDTIEDMDVDITSKESNCKNFSKTLKTDTNLDELSKASSDAPRNWEQILVPRIDMRVPSLWNCKNEYLDRTKLKLSWKRRTCSNPCKYHSFIKRKDTTSAAAVASITHMDRISNALDLMVEFDNISTSVDFLERDQNIWSAKYTDSLCDTLPKVKVAIHPYPITEIISDGRRACGEMYIDHLCEDNAEKFQYTHERISDEFTNLYSSIVERQPISLDRKGLCSDVLPTLQNMCSSEENKKACQRKRNNRRFLHYFDTVGIVLDDHVKNTLASYSMEQLVRT